MADTPLGLSKSELLKAYRTMRTIREFEERLHVDFGRGDIPGFVHLYAGEEAAGTGIMLHLGDGDRIASTHRGHGHCIARGARVDRMFAEFFGKTTGYCKGRGGSMHIADVSAGNLGANGIVAGGMPIAVGAALSAKMQKNGKVVVCFFGDGANNEGAFHESLNMAAIWKLPVVFVCENNGYSELTPIDDMVGQSDLWKRARGYGMLGGRYDGNDPGAVREAAREAIDRARRGMGPTLIELMTERLVGHYLGDPQHYRAPDEVEQASAREPIIRLRAALAAQGISEMQLDSAVLVAREEIEQATAKALGATEVDPSTALEHVYG